MNEEHKVWLEKWKNHSEIERQFSPNNWGYAALNPEKAYAADCPTLLAYESLYGEGNSSDWIQIQILALYGSSSNKDKGVADGIRIFSQSFASQVGTFKLSELMLFFARYKAGKYDNSYTTFDTKRIGNAFFSGFVPERIGELGMIERKKSTEESLSRRELPKGYVIPEGYNPYTWYKERLRRGELKSIDK